MVLDDRRVEEKMEYKVPKAAESDYLNVIRFLSSDFFRYKPIRLILICCVFFESISIVITVYFFIQVLSIDEVLNYSTLFTIEVMLTFTILLLFHLDKPIHNINNELFLWSLENIEPKVAQKIQKNMCFVNQLILIFSMFAIIAGCSFSYYSDSDRDLLFVFKFLEDHSCKWLIIIFKINIPILALVILAPVNQLVYYGNHVRFQGEMYQEYLKHITNIKQTKNYQKIIRQRLIFCINRMVKIQEAGTKKTNEIKLFMPIFAILAIFVGSGLVIYYVFCDHLSIINSIRVNLITFTSFCTFSGVIWTGQTIENFIEESELIYKQIDWTNFNEENKQIYLINYIHVMRRRTIRISENYSINYEFGVAILRGIYTVGSILARKM